MEIRPRQMHLLTEFITMYTLQLYCDYLYHKVDVRNL